MKREEEQPAESVEWHLIARGGDMTARVHGDLHLGENAGGELSFEPEEAILDLQVEAGHLKLTVLKEDLLLAIPDEEPAETILVNPNTHVMLGFLGHTLAIDNDFARARSQGETLPVQLVKKGSPVLRPEVFVALQPLAGDVRRKYILPDDQTAVDPPAGWWKVPVGLGMGLITVVATLVVLALKLPVWLEVKEARPDVPAVQPVAPETPGLGTDTQTGTASVPESEPALQTQPTAEGEAVPPEPEQSEVMPDMSTAVLSRLAVLLGEEELPGRTTLDFMIVSLKSLRHVYPEDERLTEALTALTLRLVAEARLQHDRGDAVEAGRLLSIADSTGVAGDVIAATETYVAAEPATGSVVPDVVTNADADSLDALIERALGGQEVPAAASAGMETADPVVLPLADREEGEPDSPVEGHSEIPPASADALPEGFALEDPLPEERDPPAAAPPDPSAAPADGGLRFYPLSDLVLIYREPLAYPPGAAAGTGGAVDVMFTVTETGEVTDVAAEGELDPLFIQAAEQTISRWRFEPVILERQPVRVRSAIRVRYEG